jgi:hypothetical protein
LKPLNLLEVNKWTSRFVEQLIVSILKACRSLSAKNDVKMTRIFGVARDMPALGANLNWFIKKRIGKSGHLALKDVKRLEPVMEKVQSILRKAAQA